MRQPLPNPEMLVVARESRRITQTELASQTGVAQGTLSKCENGLLPVTDEVVRLYSETLRYPESFFYESPRLRRLPVTFYRKLKATSNPALRAVDAQMMVLRLQLSKLLRSVESPPHRVPSVTLEEPNPSASAADVADELRQRWHVPPGPIRDITSLVEDNGVFVVKWHFDVPTITGLSLFEPEDNLPPVILVNAELPSDRCRFTIAHELAHIVLHHHQPLPPAKSEEEADEFAGEFLMPRSEIKPFLNHVSIEKLADLKRYWRTSMQAILVRAHELDAISDSQNERLWATMGKLGYRKNEPFPVPPEEPSLLKELVTFHMNRLNYSTDELSAALCANREDFARTYLGETTGPKLRLVDPKSPISKQDRH